MFFRRMFNTSGIAFKIIKINFQKRHWESLFLSLHIPILNMNTVIIHK